MSRKVSCTLTSVVLANAYDEFILEREGKNYSQATLEFYYFTAGKFLEWAESTCGVYKPDDLNKHHVRMYTKLLQTKGRKDTTVWNNARAIQTMLSFWYADGIMQAAIKVDLPKVLKRKLPRLSPTELDKLLKKCNTRDRAILGFFADSGVRRQELINLNWDDVNIHTGLVRVIHGKGGKDRSTVVGARGRRLLLIYRRSLPPEWMFGVLFKTDEGTRFTSNGMLAIFRRLSKLTGIHVSPHMLRRTWTNLSLRAGVDSLHLQHLGGWEDMTMLDHYAQVDEMDLLRARRDRSPLDKLDQLKRDDQADTSK